MAHISDYKSPNDKIWLEGMETACLICREESPYNIFWDDKGRKFYVCKDCEYIIKGLYKDVVFQESANTGLPIEDIFKLDLEKMQKIKKVREKNKMFQYAVYAGIVDFFDPSFTIEQILSDDDSRESYEMKINQIKSYLKKQEHEEPHTIRFFSLPNFIYSQMDVYAIAKISNNGSTYVFGDDPDILSFLARNSTDEEPDKII